jgi:Carboxypeptidase regulatory-like domain
MFVRYNKNMLIEKQKFFFLKISVVLLFVFASSFVHASMTDGTIDPVFHSAQVCENDSCTSTATSGVNFGYFTNTPSSNVHILDTELTGYIWGSSFGWVNLNCAQALSGCNSNNGNFKVVNTTAGNLSGYAWGENSGWINFGPFANSNTSPINIDSNGEFKGYAWSQNFGWIKFDCASGVDFCVKTDWRPLSARPVSSGNSGHAGGSGGGGGNSGGGSGGGGGNIGGGSNGGSGSGSSGSGSGGGSGNISNGGSGAGGGNTGGGSNGGSGSGSSGGSNNGGGSGDGSTGSGPVDGGTPVDGGSSDIGTGISTTLTAINNTISSGLSYFSGFTKDILGGAPISVRDSISSTKKITKEASLKTAKVLNTPQGNIVVKSVAVAGVVSGAAISLASAMFMNPLTFSELFLIPIRLWALLMSALGLKKRNKPWGVVYDSVTKQPIDPAYVIAQDMDGNEVATSITDMEGRYGFLLPPGNYKIIAHKSNYEFPSKKLDGNLSDELYSDLYYGGSVTLEENDGVLTKNIPMDPLSFDWNEFTKKQNKLSKFNAHKELILAKISEFMFAIGFFITSLATFVSPKFYNVLLLVVYLLIYILKKTILKPRPYGTIKSNDTGRPLSFAVLKVYLSNSSNEYVHRVADKNGKFYCLIPNGQYTISIDRKNADESYTEVYREEGIKVEDGYINKKFNI